MENDTLKFGTLNFKKCMFNKITKMKMKLNQDQENEIEEIIRNKWVVQEVQGIKIRRSMTWHEGLELYKKRKLNNYI